MKLYTKRGDAGQTELFGGQAIGKSDRRIEAIGDVDELNSLLGLAAATCDHDEWVTVLHDVQSRLFDIGAQLSSPGPSRQAIPQVTADHVTELEQQIDMLSDEVPAMKHFILPGGTELAARFHLARTVCRRAERRCVALHEADEMDPRILVYLNRLSDLLFAFARSANARADVMDLPWIASTRSARE